MLSGDANFLQAAKNFLGHAAGQIDEAVIFTDHQPADVAAFDTRFVRNRTDDIRGLHAVHRTDFDAIRPQLEIFIARGWFARCVALLDSLTTRPALFSTRRQGSNAGRDAEG